jgi:pimeloyl-ACP methyl ester carboxylesterase
MLRALRDASGVDSSRVTVVGHSVGATIAIRLAARHDWVAGAVLLCGACQSGLVVMQRQSERIAASFGGLQRLFAGRFLRGQERVRKALLASTGDVVREARQELPAGWFREYMGYDPRSDLRAVRCPVLAITGQKDLQVEHEDVARIGELVQGPFTGLTPADLTHVLRTDDGAPSLSSYSAQLQRPVDASLLETVVAWTAAGELHTDRP